MFNFHEKTILDFRLKLLKSTIFSEKIEHFFTTRVGGDTPAPLNSFTLSAKDCTEYKDFEIKNQKIACKLLNGDYKNMIMPNQQHTDNIAIIKNIQDIAKIKEEAFDGIITNLKGFPVCLVFADCVPVLIFDEKNEILACVHAGWKGSAKSIAQKTIHLMQKEFKSNVQDIKVAIGAAICSACFEVNKDVANQLAITIKNNHDKIFINKADKVHVDLKRLNREQLKEIDIEHIDMCEYCTSCQNNIFYSYRADDRCTGRHGLLAMIKE